MEENHTLMNPKENGLQLNIILLCIAILRLTRFVISLDGINLVKNSSLQETEVCRFVFNLSRSHMRSNFALPSPSFYIGATEYLESSSLAYELRIIPVILQLVYNSR